MRDARLEIRVERELLERIDDARGIAPRSRWIEEAIVAALGERLDVGVKRRREEIEAGAPRLVPGAGDKQHGGANFEHAVSTPGFCSSCKAKRSPSRSDCKWCGTPYEQKG